MPVPYICIMSLYQVRLGHARGQWQNKCLTFALIGFMCLKQKRGIYFYLWMCHSWKSFLIASCVTEKLSSMATYTLLYISLLWSTGDIIILHFVTNIHSWKSFLTALCVAKKLLSMASYTLFYISPLWSTRDIVILHLFTNILHHVQSFTNTELCCHWQHQRFS